MSQDTRIQMVGKLNVSVYYDITVFNMTLLANMSRQNMQSNSKWHASTKKSI